MLLNEKSELTLEFLLRSLVFDIISIMTHVTRNVITVNQSRHILDKHDTHLIASLIEEGWLNFNLKTRVSGNLG